MKEASKNPRRPRRGAYLIPSLITVGNMFLGFYALMQTVRAALSSGGGIGHFDSAAKAIGWAIVFDGWDGRVARIMGTTSDFGREFDSLADVVTFGVAPAYLAYAWGIAAVDPSNAGVLHDHINRIGLFLSFLFLICGAARLARFNIQTNPMPSNPGRPGRKYFVGLPIPAGAGVVAAVVHFRSGEINEWWGWPIMWLAMLLVTSLLMVSPWRYYSFKDIDLSRERRFVTVVSIAGLIGAIWFYSEVVLLGIALAYLGSGVVFKLTAMARRPKPPLLLLCAMLCLSGCGYHVSGHGDNIPKTIQTISVPAFKNETPRFKIEQSLTTAVVRELISRTRYTVQSKEESSDAVLLGVVTGFYTIPVIFDPQNNRATTVSVNVRLRVSLTDRKTKKVLYENADYLYSERYEISRDAAGYFDESGPAMERLSRSFAASLVSSILEGF